MEWAGRGRGDERGEGKPGALEAGVRHHSPFRGGGGFRLHDDGILGDEEGRGTLVSGSSGGYILSHRCHLSPRSVRDGLVGI